MLLLRPASCLSGSPYTVDVFPYTLEEVKSGQPVVCEVLHASEVLWVRPGVEFLALIAPEIGTCRVCTAWPFFVN